MQTNFHKLSKPELNIIRENCNLTPDEHALLDMASKRMSDIQIADRLNISTSTVTKRKKKLRIKINDYLRGDDIVTVNVYINGIKIPDKDKAKELEKYGFVLAENNTFIKDVKIDRQN